MTFHKCSIYGKKHGESSIEEPTMEQEVATGRITKAPTPIPDAETAMPSKEVSELSNAVM